MRRFAFGFGLSLLATACTHYETLWVDGEKREFLVHVPAGEPPATGWPAIIAYHGAFTTPEATESYTRLSELAESEGFVVFYPKGERRLWNDGRMPDEHDDVAFTDALIDHAISSYEVDEARVYATGISNGGFMSHRVACDLSDRIAAVAPVAGTLSEPLADRCDPAKPVPMMLFLGTDDDLVAYEGGELGGRFGGRTYGTMLSAEDSAQNWAAFDGCAREHPVETHDQLADGTSVETRRWTECEGGGEVVLHTIVGGGHTWPGADEVPFLGTTTEELDANATMWAFFRAAAPRK